MIDAIYKTFGEFYWVQLSRRKYDLADRLGTAVQHIAGGNECAVRRPVPFRSRWKLPLTSGQPWVLHLESVP
jgi:hypothetical protein